MRKEFINVGLEDLKKVSKEIILNYRDDRIFCIYGEIGAGKTTLIKNLCNVLGVSVITSSPTFSIVNEYNIENHIPIYHFDFYRINSILEVYDIGFEEYIYSGSYCFIEWAEKISELLSTDFVKVKILETQKSLLRTIICEK